MRSDEYRRLVRMLDRESKRDPTWRWQNCSIPKESPIMTEEEAQLGDIYEKRIREHMERIHIVLYILRDEWIEEFGSLYLELVEGTAPRLRPIVPIISVLPRGANLESLKYEPLGIATVKWDIRSIVRAIREHAIPISPDELRLTSVEKAERARIVDALQANAGNIAGTAESLGISMSTLRRRRIKYIIR